MKEILSTEPLPVNLVSKERSHMMKQWMNFILAMFLVLIVFSCAKAADNMQAFPEPEDGYARYVLHLPDLKDESTAKVELIVGKVVQVDKDNRYFFSGSIERKTIEGWGYTAYMVKDIGPMAGTLMAVDPAVPKIERFITLGGGPYLIRYNSKLPVVVYVPAGVEVRYRIWNAEPELKPMEKG